MQPDGGESTVQNRIVGDVKFPPVDAPSFAFTSIACTAPCAPTEVSFDATVGVLNVAFTTPLVPTANVDVFDTNDVAAVLSVVDPAPPPVTVVDATVLTPTSSNRTL